MSVPVIEVRLEDLKASDVPLERAVPAAVASESCPSLRVADSAAASAAVRVRGASQIC